MIEPLLIEILIILALPFVVIYQGLRNTSGLDKHINYKHKGDELKC